ncbi:MAG: O-antigen ligase family protein [Deltaproteobacteria bacterium]|nr:O-antigen ligase family protein [Deltaproteobacteria bacterium]
MLKIKEKLSFAAGHLDVIGLFLVAIALPLSEGLKNIGIAIAFLGFILNLYYKKKSIIITPFGWGLIAIFLSGLISTIVALNKSASVKGLWDISRYSLLFFIAANCIDKEYKIKVLQWGLLLSLVAGGLWGMVAIPWGKPLEILSLGQFNHTGIYIAIMLSMTLSILIFTKNFLEKIFSICIFLILLISLFLTTSRGSFVGFGMAMVTILVFYKSPLKNRKAQILLLLLFIGIGGYFYSPLNVKTGSFDSNRFKLWKLSVKTFQEHPIAGIGLNNYYLSGHEFAGFRHAHNLYLNTAVQTGVIGLTALAITIAGAFLVLQKTKTLKEAEGIRQILWFSALGAYAVVLVSGLFNTTLHHEHGMLFTMLFGMLVSCSRFEDS